MSWGKLCQFPMPGFFLVGGFASLALFRLFIAGTLFDVPVESTGGKRDDMFGFTLPLIGKLDLPGRALSWRFKMVGNESIEQRTRVLWRFRTPIASSGGAW
jgi:hypothetical protein